MLIYVATSNWNLAIKKIRYVNFIKLNNMRFKRFRNISYKSQNIVC